MSKVHWCWSHWSPNFFHKKKSLTIYLFPCCVFVNQDSSCTFFKRKLRLVLQWFYRRPAPGDRRVKETLPPLVSLCGVSTSVEMVSNGYGSRAEISDCLRRPDDCVEDDYNDVSQRRDVTVSSKIEIILRRDIHRPLTAQQTGWSLFSTSHHHNSKTRIITIIRIKIEGYLDLLHSTTEAVKIVSKRGRERKGEKNALHYAFTAKSAKRRRKAKQVWTE